MVDRDISRKLAVIVHADVVDSTGLVQRNETLAHKRVIEAFQRFSSIIRDYGGTVHEVRGDALVSEFARASDAVNASLSFQHEHKEHLRTLGDEIRPEVRIGISLGEVVFADNTVTGPGVVLAQRVEQLTQPGGVCLQGAVYEAVPRRLPFDYDNLGEQEVKGFDEPVRVYSIRLKDGESIPVPEREKKYFAWWKPAVAAWVSIAVIVVVWHRPWEPREEPASIDKMVFPLPHKPSIVVLPFEVPGSESIQHYLGYGLTNDLITALSKFSNLFVIASHSSFAYKDEPAKVHTVSEELGVRYVLRGSVQKSTARIRINAQLIDALSGRHLWADRFDRQTSDLLAIQDDIVEKVVAILAIHVDAAERERVETKHAGNLEAYDYYLRANDIRFDWNKATNQEARRLLTRATELDSDYARAYSALAWTYVNDWRWGWTEDPESTKTIALETARKAAELDPFDPDSHHALGVVHLYNREFDKAVPLYEKAIALNPNDARRLVGTAPAWIYVGRPKEAVAQIERALRLNPHHSDEDLNFLSWAYYEAKEYEKALATIKRVEKSPWRSVLAVTYVRLGEMEKAQAEIKVLLNNDPEYSIERGKVYPYKDKDQWEHFYNALAEAGVPDYPPLELPDKPSIAVLPFDNMSADPEQEYFVDGMTEDLITDLSKISGLFVIARNSSFAYKDKIVDVKSAARDLGVRYVMEGSVRRAGNQVRINAQLIDATTGGHLWADRYDGSLQDIFALQDQVTQQIVAALKVNLTGEEQMQQARHATDNTDAHDAYLQGWAHYKLGKPEDLARGIPYFEEAVRLDPDYSHAHAALAAVYWDAYVNDWAFDIDMPSTRAESRANKHLEEALKAPTPLAHAVQSLMFASFGFHNEAVVEAEKAAALDPNDAEALAGLAKTLVLAERPNDGLTFIQDAMRLDPHYPPSYLIILGAARFGSEQYEEAVATFKRAVKRNPNNELPYIYLASSYGHLGRINEGQDVVESVNDLRASLGKSELSLEPRSSSDYSPFRGGVDFIRIGVKKAQERLRAGLSDIPALKWQYLVTVLHGANTSYDIEGATRIDLATAKSFHDRGVLFIDVGTENEGQWKKGRVPGALNLPWSRDPNDPTKKRIRQTTLSEIADKTQEVVFYWWTPGSPGIPAFATAKAVSWGYEKVYYFKGGAQAWREAGYPIETDDL